MSTYISMNDLRLRLRGMTFFFDRDTSRFFKSRYSMGAWLVAEMVAYFVTSEKQGDQDRRYSVRRADLRTGRVSTVGKFQQHATLKRAESAMRCAIASELATGHGENWNTAWES